MDFEISLITRRQQEYFILMNLSIRKGFKVINKEEIVTTHAGNKRKRNGKFKQQFETLSDKVYDHMDTTTNDNPQEQGITVEDKPTPKLNSKGQTLTNLLLSQPAKSSCTKIHSKLATKPKARGIKNIQNQRDRGISGPFSMEPVTS